MDLPRVKALNDYWDENPPLHLMAKAYLGIGKDKPPKTPPRIGHVVEPAAVETIAAGLPSSPNPQAMTSAQLRAAFEARAALLAEQEAKNGGR